MESKSGTLEEIYESLTKVSDMLYAINRGEGDDIAHWQEIGLLDHRLRHLAKSLPDDIFSQMPHLAAFTLSSNPIYGCWGNCLDEVKEYLSAQ